MSIYKVYYDNLSNLKDLSVKVAQSIVAVLQRYSMEELTVKWPNDILYKNQKLCGILIETRQRRQQQIDTVIGIGLNLIDMQPYAQQISQPCIGLTEIITDQDIYDTLAANHYSLLIHEITSEIVKDN